MAHIIKAGGWFERLNPLKGELNLDDLITKIVSLGTKWGQITGVLSDQTDLQSALDLKSDIEVSNLAAASALSFTEDTDTFIDGGTYNFTLASSGNVNGVGRYIRINTPTLVTFSGDFIVHPDSAIIDPAKLNVILLIYFDNWDGINTPKVLYKNSVFTAV